MYKLMMIMALLLSLISSGCNPFYNKNGMSIWGYSKEKDDDFIHAGFISTDFMFGNAGNTSQTFKEKMRREKQLADDLGFGTVGIYGGKKF